MIDPVTITISAISLIGTIVVSIIQLFKSGWSCENIKSSCCVFASEIDD